MQAKMEEKEDKELVWAGSTWMIGCTLTVPVTEESVCIIITNL